MMLDFTTKTRCGRSNRSPHNQALVHCIKHKPASPRTQLRDGDRETRRGL